MNKAVELISEWINNKEQYLEILKDRASSQQHWKEHGNEDQVEYFTTKYQETIKEIDDIMKGLKECYAALTLLINTPAPKEGTE